VRCTSSAFAAAEVPKRVGAAQFAETFSVRLSICTAFYILKLNPALASRPRLCRAPFDPLDFTITDEFDQAAPNALLVGSRHWDSLGGHLLRVKVVG
jgi:hypothetical protein